MCSSDSRKSPWCSRSPSPPLISPPGQASGAVSIPQPPIWTPEARLCPGVHEKRENRPFWESRLCPLTLVGGLSKIRQPRTPSARSDTRPPVSFFSLSKGLRRTLFSRSAFKQIRKSVAVRVDIVLAPFLYAWVSEDECAPDLRGHQSRLRPTAIPPALECRSATRFTPRLRAASRSGDDARPPPTPP